MTPHPPANAFDLYEYISLFHKKFSARGVPELGFPRKIKCRISERNPQRQLAGPE